ncbi:unnamed protein product [Rhizopus stolonifer]
MSNWNELPTEILNHIFSICACCGFPIDLASNLFPLFWVSKNWRNVALQVGYQTIVYHYDITPPPDNFFQDKDKEYQLELEPHVLNAIKIQQAGHSTRTLLINSWNDEHLENLFLHFATYCPNVTKLYCPTNRELVWTYLKKSLYFKKLIEISGPKDESEMKEFIDCTWHYKDQLQSQYALAYHPMDSRLQLQLQRLDQFPKTKSLVIYWCHPARLASFDKLVDACPHITKINFHRVYLQRYSLDWTAPCKEGLCKPHESLITLGAQFFFDPLLFDYIMHKFPKLKRGEIDVMNRDDKKEEQDQYLVKNLDKLVEFTTRNRLTIKLSISLARLKEALGNTRLKCLKLFFYSDGDRLDLAKLILIKEEITVVHPVESLDYITINPMSGGLVTSDIFKDAWCPVSANITNLRIEIPSPSNEYVTFGIFMDIFEYASSLTHLSYKAQTRLSLDRHLDDYKVCETLESLGLYVSDVHEDVYPVFSKCCPGLKRMDLELLLRMSVGVTRIDMLESHFEFFQFSLNIEKGK